MPYTGNPLQAPAGTVVVEDWPNLGPVIAEGNGKFYGLKNGKKTYLPPQVVAQSYHPTDASGAEIPLTDADLAARKGTQDTKGGNLLLHHSEFDPSTGDRSRSVDWANVVGLGIGGAIAAPAIAGAVGAGGGSSVAPAAAGGSTTGSIAAPVATAAAKGAASSWLTGNTAGLISQGIGIAGNIYATKKQADAAEEAARLQNEQYDKALEAAKEEQTYNRAQTEEQKAYSRNQYASYLSRLDPYAQTGAASNDRLAAFMGQPSRPVARADGGYSQPMIDKAPTARPVTAPGPTSAPQVQLVKLQGPDGSTKDVPAVEVPHWVQLGAKVIGGQGAVA